MANLPSDFGKLSKVYGWQSGTVIKIGFTLLTADQDLDIDNHLANKNPITDTVKQQQILKIFNLWGQYANISFAIDNANPNIRIGKATLSGSEFGQTLNAIDDDIDPTKILKSEIYISDQYIDYNAGPGGFFWMMHEAGHALGLADIDNIVNWDTNDVSVMAYSGGQYTNNFNRPETPMIYDIYAIQKKYGVNSKFHNSTDNYTFTGVEKAKTIWDGGGVDTLDASKQTSTVTLDLREGFDKDGKQFVTKVGNEVVFNAYHANIENAKGGSGNDFIYGNDKQDAVGQYAAFSGKNQLEGGSGNDKLYGYGGEDILIGGDNNDTLDGGDGDDLLYGGSGDDTFIINDGEGLDIIMDHDAYDKVVFNGIELNGGAETIENGVYKLKGLALTRSKDGDLLIYSPNDLVGGMLIDNFFPAGYDGHYLYKMGMSFFEDEHVAEDYEHPIVPPASTCPIVLDLNGDGLKYIPYNRLSFTHAHFDLDNDGFAEGVEWLDKNDGFLVRDLNGNGAIDNQKEMFGNNDGTTAYAKLALYDTNKDGKVNSSDTTFTTLKIWQDLDGDGRTDAGELKTLAQAGISNLSLQLTNATTDANGHAIAGTSTFTRTDGTVGNAADAILQMGNGDTYYVGSDTVTPPKLDPSTLFLPLYRGHGTLKPLHYAMTDNPILKQMVVDLMNIDIQTQMYEVYDRVNNIIMEWAGVAGMLPTGQETNKNAAKIAVIKKYLDTDTVNTPVDITYNKILLDVLTKLMVQGPLHKVFPEAHYRYDFNRLDISSSATIAAITDWNAATKKMYEGAKIYEPTNPLDKNIYWDVILHVMQTTRYGVNDISIAESVAGMPLGDSYNGVLIGTSGNDELTSSDVMGYFNGLKGDDIYHVPTESNIHYNLGDGNDTITNNYSADTADYREINIYFGVGISFDTMTFQYVANATTSGAEDLIITIPGSGSIRVIDVLRTPTMKFADGSVKGYEDVNYKIYGGMGTAGDDELYGTSAGVVLKGFGGNDFLSGGTGNDTIYGGDGNDIVSGNAGNDKLYGENGDDYIDGGIGADIIDGGAGSDTVSYYTTNTAVNVNLSLTTAQSGGAAQGDILSNIENIVGTSDSDTLIGNSGDNIIQGRNGWDKIDGGAGNDTVVYGGWTAVNIDLSLTTAQTSGGAEGYGDTVINIENIIGTGGNDTLTGNSVDNVIEGNYGSDKIDGSTGNDTASYKTSNYAVNVNLGITTAQSGGHAEGDTLLNMENIIASAYDDKLTGNSVANKIDGGAGIDTVSYSNSNAAVTVNLAATTPQVGGYAQGDTLFNIENITGSSYNDILTGTLAANKIDGGSGVDTVSYSNSNAAVTVKLGVTTAQTGGYAQGDSLVSIESIIGSTYNDIFTSSSVANKIDGGSGVDTISYAGSSAAVTVNLGVTTAQTGGYAAGDTLFNIENIIGSSYNDIITGSSLANRIEGASGVDTVSYANSTAAVNVNLGLTTAQSGGYAAGDTLVSIENIIGSAYNDTLTGSSASNKIDGGAGIDTVSYASSNAAVNVNLAVTTTQSGGHAAGDTLFNIENIIGSSYNDTLKGTTAANIITGGAGKDTMTGAAGADVFKFSAITDSGKVAGARDIITDFVKGTDKIDLADFAGTFTFKGTGALGGSVHGVNYAQASGNTIIGIDADGNGTLDMQIQLTGLHALTASDFLL